jgi:hypothetical protein
LVCHACRGLRTGGFHLPAIIRPLWGLSDKAPFAPMARVDAVGISASGIAGTASCSHIMRDVNSSATTASLESKIT